MSGSQTRRDRVTVSDKPLVFVSGKSGAGKTTVAAALGLAAVAEGHRVLVCELAGSSRLAPAFGRPVSKRETELRSGLWSLTIDADEALHEWLARQAGPAAAILRHSPAFAYFVAAAPGATELVTLGKAIDLAREGRYDTVIVDGRATGHALGMLAAPRTFAYIAPLAAIGREAEELHEFLTDRTSYVGRILTRRGPLLAAFRVDALPVPGRSPHYSCHANQHRSTARRAAAFTRKRPAAVLVSS
jgi:anion-transporting  ArsA/GET3 family ATPase